MSVFKELKNQERLEEYINFYINFQQEMDNDWTLFGLVSALNVVQGNYFIHFHRRHFSFLPS